MSLYIANVNRKTEAPDSPARRCQGVKGEPGPKGAPGLRNPCQLPERREPRRLPALCKDEVGPHY